ncbi:MAG: 2-C-methyl-D-erythritol 4-phosphate cytidylyltransferase [Clostridium sp.]|nr:2-C-methyl-D-erythritol 4-phosphate cytidylyltransferase [Clostridium sp.]
MDYAIIVAAGSGTRFGGDTPKQFCMLGDMPVLMHTAKRIGRALPQARLAIVLSPEYSQMWEKMCEKYGFVSPLVVEGGASRWESVKKALNALQPADDSVVYIHDGVRPVVPSAVIKNISKAMASADAAIPAIPVTDSLRRINPDGSSEAEDRSALVAVQTPQAFRAGKLSQAYALPFSPAFTDDASVYEAAGFGSPLLVEGSPLNIKITHPRDIEVAALYI